MFQNLVGQTLGRYKILSRLGDGPLGPVFKAGDASLQREVAIKLVPAALTAPPGLKERFTQAARVAARLDHPNLVQVFDVGEVEQGLYIVMEYIPGPNLVKMLQLLRRSGRWLNLHEAVDVVRQFALAYEYIRSQDSSSRAVKPTDMMIKPTQVNHLPYLPVLTDLGLDVLIDRRSSENSAIDPAYLSPEGALGRVTDARSDVYSLGVLLYELCTGQLPFPIESLDDAVRYHTRQPLTLPRTVRPDLPGELETILVTALEKSAAARQASPAVLANQLEGILPAIQSIHTSPPAFESTVSLLVPYREGLAEKSPAAPPAPYEESTRVTPAQTRPAPARPAPQAPRPLARADMLFESANLNVLPGETAATTITLVNQGGEAIFSLSVEGLAPEWVTCSPHSVRLAPGEQRNFRVSIHPPRDARSRAGRYPLNITAVSPGSPAPVAEGRLILTVGAFFEYRSELNTPHLNPGETGQITVNNLGNTQEAYTLSFRDAQGELNFNPPQVQLRLAEGQTGIAEYQATLAAPHWIGADRSYYYSAQVAASSGDTQAHSGEIRTRALIPTWVLAIFLIATLCVGGGLTAYFGNAGLSARRATVTYQAMLTGVAGGTVQAMSGTAAAETATAGALLNANVATQRAATSTAGWLTLDSDNDGLTNQRELELGTVPDRVDTDGDSLGDGDEVRAGLNPLRPDSDQDGIRDEDELRLRLNPLNPDTDGDGLADGRDPAPLATSTPIPNLNATAQFFAAQTAAAQQATQAAAAATANAGSAAATIAAATANANSGAATIAAATANANAAAATAAAATATAAARVTQTAGAPISAIYIYLIAPNEARDFQALLNANGFRVDLAPLDAISSNNLEEYQLIIIGPDTGSEGNWGDLDGNLANALLELDRPIVGIGVGGFTFFQRTGIAGSLMDGQVLTNQRRIQVIDGANRVWNNPFQLGLSSGQAIELFTGGSDVAGITLAAPPGDAILLATLPDDPNDPDRYGLLGQGRYLLWGFSAGPRQLTQLGQQVFVNFASSLFPPR